MKICIIDGGVFLEKQELIKPLEKIGEVKVYTGVPESLDEVLKRASDADIIAFALMNFNRQVLEKLPKLKMLQFIGTGVNNFVDMDYAKEKGIEVLNISNYGSNAVAEYALGMAFSLARHIPQGMTVLKSGSWNQEGLQGKEISGSKVGVLGTGSIGALVAEKYHNLGAEVIACDIYENENLKTQYGIKYCSMEEIFKTCDIISLHMTVTKENEKVIDKKLISSMKEDALLINVARAELVDTQALYDALMEKKIGGAAIDVYNTEPPVGQDMEIAAMENVIATPHIGFYSEQANDNSISMSVDSILENLDKIV
ncbi:MAG: NAD(P)-dependent oxidoreductase [Prevotellaceae bacterium]|nr:NAD(P)-dependent oxidoreductase [Prevotellaceae bacterium]